jgi:hypothetical protein
MSKLELKVGGQYKTRGGWRCVVVDDCGGGYYSVWHSNLYQSLEKHRIDGVPYMDVHNRKADIISEWKEPRVGETYINMYDKMGRVHFNLSNRPDAGHAIAVKKITMQEGQFDD